MEVYESGNELVGYPTPLDCSLDTTSLIGFFGRRAKMFCESTANKYLFSYNNDFLCIVPYRSDTYRVVGRLDNNYKCIKHTIDYDVFCVGNFDVCLDYFNKVISSYVLII